MSECDAKCPCPLFVRANADVFYNSNFLKILEFIIRNYYRIDYVNYIIIYYNLKYDAI